MTALRRSAVLLAGFAILIGVASAHAAGPTPADVYADYTKAMEAGDVAAAAKFVVADVDRLRLVTARPAAAESEKAFRAAIETAFPGQFKDVGYDVPTTQPEEPVRAPRVIVNGDTATMISRDSPDTVRFRRVDGQWKVDLNAMFSPATVENTERYRGALVEVMNALAAEVKAGRYKTLDEVQADLATRVKMRLANPDQPATTRPVF